MLEFKNKKIDDWGRVIYKTNALFEQIYSGNSIDGVLADDSKDILQYNKFVAMFDINLQQLKQPDAPGVSAAEFHHILQNDWIIPTEYQAIDLEKFLLDKCNTDIERNRVQTELRLYEEREMYNILKFLIYLVDIMRKNSIVWGAGRGSSVSSYVLYLIGVHKINSLKYNLDIGEFLR